MIYIYIILYENMWLICEVWEKSNVWVEGLCGSGFRVSTCALAESMHGFMGDIGLRVSRFSV